MSSGIESVKVVNNELVIHEWHERASGYGATTFTTARFKRVSDAIKAFYFSSRAIHLIKEAVPQHEDKINSLIAELKVLPTQQLLETLEGHVQW